MKRILLNTKISKIYMISVILITLLLLTSYFSYAMFTVSKEKSNAISIVTGTLSYDLKVDGVSTDKLVVGPKEEKIFLVSLSNPNNRIARFNLYYKGNLDQSIEAGYIIDCESIKPPEATGINLEATGTIGSSETYKIIVYNDSNKEQTITLGVSVGLDYNDLSLENDEHLFLEYGQNVNTPELDTNMIAVKYVDNNWVKANTNNTDNDWYNYSEQKWANAVTVSSSTRESYKSASVGTVINMDDIETMWVWIPRYSYSIASIDGTNYYGRQVACESNSPTQALPGEIDIKFVRVNVKEKGTARYNINEGMNSNSWYTPDAFTFGDEELSGIWVGKFETSSSNPDAEYGGGDTTTLDPIIKPNVISWRNISISNAFNVSIKMNDAGNRYGFSSSVDTHMMKNSEWATVAYLSQSRYGKLGNTDFSNANKEIYQNKSDQYITGCSYGEPSNGNTDYGCHYTYDIDINGTGSSTTGNIYGIYDMSGGAWEFIMANYNGIGMENIIIDSKYYDQYTSDNTNTACSGKICLSHALSETNNWYNDSWTMVNSAYPWIIRGGYYGDKTDAGIFHYYNYISSGRYNGSFRLVLNAGN
ncbi:MAG TPA: hypothetical protein IAB45_02520 [Candidatus Onthousia faecavium]|nr:hypothetical protein [Candidatus Onthousia faecavium]